MAMGLATVTSMLKPFVLSLWLKKDLGFVVMSIRSDSLASAMSSMERGILQSSRAMPTT